MTMDNLPPVERITPEENSYLPLGEGGPPVAVDEGGTG